ncbi:MAG: hypothetical protein BWK76_01980 [Desulfobulbaceae bacterium A2]|nr:MAG: hypothetical protein BWK76_01980 [Desulfobulbaceae bacterium A2]
MTEQIATSRTEGGGIRARKRRVLALLAARPTTAALAEWLAAQPPAELVDPLIAALFHTDEELHWRAVEGLGLVVVRLAEQELEAARVVIRRLMWSLNEESGGIGWGAPEAMAEILARHPGLATEYCHIFLSYLRADGAERWQHGNFLEHEGLQRGLLWGLARLRRARPALVGAADIAPEVIAFLASPDPTVRGFAARCLGLLAAREARAALQPLCQDTASISLWQDGRLQSATVAALAAEALARLDTDAVSVAGERS